MLDKNGFIDVKWHEIQIPRLGSGKNPNPELSAYSIFGHSLSIAIKHILYSLSFLN